jgi:Fe-S cluster biogenesis protein NfuA
LQKNQEFLKRDIGGWAPGHLAGDGGFIRLPHAHAHICILPGSCSGCMTSVAWQLTQNGEDRSKLVAWVKMEEKNLPENSSYFQL